jgi:hypothetical protein
LVVWEQLWGLLVWVVAGAGWLPFELVGGQAGVAVAGAGVVVVVAATTGVGAVGDWALTAVPAPSQLLTTLDRARVLASSDSRVRQL